MIVTSIRYGLTVQPRQYESERIDLEIVPDGRPVGEILDEAVKFCNERLRAGQDNGVAAVSSDDTPPAKKKAAPKNAKVKANEKAFDIELQYVLDAQSLQEFGERFEHLYSNFAASKTPEDWLNVVFPKLRDRYSVLSAADPFDDAGREAAIKMLKDVKCQLEAASKKN